MSFIKSIFGKKSTSTNAKTQAANPHTSGNKYESMSEDDKLLAWGRMKDIPDPQERIRALHELAESGYGAACFSIAQAFMDMGIQSGTVLWNRINYWLQKAIDGDIPMAHYYKAFTSMNKENPEYDVDRGITEYCIAATKGIEPAIQAIYDYCHASDPEVAEENTEIFLEELKPYMDELLIKEDEVAWNTLGLFYFYGVYFDRDYDKAKFYFTKSGNRRMLNNPIFVEDDEDEDED